MLSSGEFLENRQKEGRSFLMAVNDISLKRAPKRRMTCRK